MPTLAPMDHVSRPLIALLAGTVLFAMVWFVALRPGGSSSGGGGTSANQLQSAVSAAHQALATSAAASIAHGGTIPQSTGSPTPSASPTSRPQANTAGGTPGASLSGEKSSASSSGIASGSTVARGHHVAAPARHGALVHTPAQRADAVARALAAGKVLALLYYNPASFDDRAVRGELAAVPSSAGKVFKLAVPISELARYPVVTNQVPVNISPTLVIVGRSRQAVTIEGFADRFEIAQRMRDALSS